MIFAAFDPICFYWMGRVQLAESALRRRKIICAAASARWRFQPYSKMKPYVHIWFHRKTEMAWQAWTSLCPGSSKPRQEFSNLHKLIFKLWYFSLEGRERAFLTELVSFGPTEFFCFLQPCWSASCQALPPLSLFKKELISHVKENRQVPST